MYVSISGNYVIIGAPNEDGGGTDRGAAYVYHRTGTNTWDTGTKITTPDTQNSDNFGWSVSIFGDYAAVSSYCEDGFGTDRGAVYLFKRTGTNAWDIGIKFSAEDNEDYDNFGYSVALSESYLITGSLREDGAGTDSGAAYIFK